MREKILEEKEKMLELERLKLEAAPGPHPETSLMQSLGESIRGLQINPDPV